METYVLIPSELSLVAVTRDHESDPRKPTNASSSSSSSSSSGSSSGSSPSVSGLASQRGRPAVSLIEGDVGGARVYSNQRLVRGKRFLPFEGTVRIDKLDIFPYLDDDDIRHCFGSYDEIQELSKWKFRQCNWVRFLRYSPVFNGEVNLLGTLVKGEPVYETVRSVPPDTELVAYFQDPESTRRTRVQRGTATGGEAAFFEWSTGAEWLRNRHFVISQYRHTMGIILEATPLDLSKSLLNSKVKVPKTELSRVVISPTVFAPFASSMSSPNPEDRLQLAVVETTYKKDATRRNYSEMAATCLSQQQKRAKERTLLPCEVCGKAFDRPSLLRRHMRTHTGEKPHVCDVCGKGFSTSSSLNTHRRIHSGEKPHQCHVCGKRFTASSNLYYHRMTHSKEKPHKCSLCSKSFPTPGDLKSHMYVHNGSWPFKCHICSRGFSKQTNLKNHLFLHTGDKPHVCSYCHKRFALACNLRAHLKTHEGEQLEQCTKCFKSFPIASGILVHGYCHSCYQNNNVMGCALTAVQAAVNGVLDNDNSKRDKKRNVRETPSKRLVSSEETAAIRLGKTVHSAVNVALFPAASHRQQVRGTTARRGGDETEEEYRDEEEEDPEEEEEEEMEEEEDGVELEEETRRQFVLGVLDQVMLRYEQAGALIAKSLELNRNGGEGSLLEAGVATSS